MDLHIGESCLNGVGSVNPERERCALGAVKLREPPVNIVGITDFYIFRERWICQYVDNALFFGHFVLLILIVSHYQYYLNC